MIWWVCGQMQSGKSTLAHRMKNAVILDGDDLRTVWKLGFSKDDRWEQNLRAARLAKIIENQGFDVVVSTICPYRDLRAEVQRICKCKFVYVEGGREPSKEYPYEV